MFKITEKHIGKRFLYEGKEALVIDSNTDGKVIVLLNKKKNVFLPHDCGLLEWFSPSSAKIVWASDLEPHPSEIYDDIKPEPDMFWWGNSEDAEKHVGEKVLVSDDPTGDWRNATLNNICSNNHNARFLASQENCVLMPYRYMKPIRTKSLKPVTEACLDKEILIDLRTPFGKANGDPLSRVYLLGFVKDIPHRYLVGIKDDDPSMGYRSSFYADGARRIEGMKYGDEDE